MKIQYPLTIKILYEKNAKETPYIAYIPEFDISSCGKSETEAIKNAKEALEILLQEVKRKGKTQEFFEEIGIVNDKTMVSEFPKIIIQPFALSI